MERKLISTDAAPEAIGPYSQAIQVGPFLYTSGQIPLDSAGNLVQGGIEAQTHQVIQNLRAVLDAAGMDFGDVVKATVFLRDLAQFALVNKIYADYFGDHKPARSTVEVSGLPRGADIEIELVAVRE